MKMTPELQKTIERLAQTKIRATLTDFYDTYENPYKIERRKVTEIFSCFNMNLMTNIAETGTSYRLPSNAGILGIERVKTKFNNALIDFDLFIKTGLKIRHKNNHSGSYIGKYF